jgi:hypothetical protein
VQAMTVYPMGLLPRGESFLFQNEGVSSAVQLNRVYILDKDVRKILRNEERLKSLKEESEAHNHAASTPAPSPDLPNHSILVGHKAAAPRARPAPAKPMREPRSARKAIVPNS